MEEGTIQEIILIFRDHATYFINIHCYTSCYYDQLKTLSKWHKYHLTIWQQGEKYIIADQSKNTSFLLTTHICSPPQQYYLSEGPVPAKLQIHPLLESLYQQHQTTRKLREKNTSILSIVRGVGRGYVLDSAELRTAFTIETLF